MVCVCRSARTIIEYCLTPADGGGFIYVCDVFKVSFDKRTNTHVLDRFGRFYCGTIDAVIRYRRNFGVDWVEVDDVDAACDCIVDDFNAQVMEV